MEVRRESTANRGGARRIDRLWDRSGARLTGDPVAGGDLYATDCATCHAADGTGGSGPSLVGKTDATAMADVILGGNGDMPPFDNLSDQEIADIIAWIQAL
ncbi:MAG: cytochrome c [Myxococcota bacterium]